MEELAFSPGSSSQQLGSACELSPHLRKARLQVSLTYKGRVALVRSRKPPGLGEDKRRIIGFWPRQRQGWLVWDRNAARKLTPTLPPRPHRTKSVPQAQGRVTESTSGTLGLEGIARPSPDLTQIVSARPTDSHQPGRSDTIKSLRANSYSSVWKRLWRACACQAGGRPGLVSWSLTEGRTDAPWGRRCRG